MLDISIRIELFDKTSIRPVIDILKRCAIDNPVYVFELPDCFRIMFDTDYEQWEFQNEIEQYFEGYEFVKEMRNGYQDLKLSFHKTQSPSSTDDWGRPWNEDPIHSARYLVKSSERYSDNHPATTFHVLFGEDIKNYTVHIAQGIYKSSQEIFYVPVKNKFSSAEAAEPVTDRRFGSVSEAFWEGYRKLTLQIDGEYQDYKKGRRTKRKKKQ